MNKKFVKNISRIIMIFLVFLEMFCGIQPLEIKAAAASTQPATLPITYDFNSYTAGTKATDLGFDMITPGAGQGDAYITQAPGKTGNALYMYDTSVDRSADYNYTKLSKTFDAQNGVVTVEMSFMQPGDTKEKSTVFEVVYKDPNPAVADRIAVRVETEPANQAFCQDGNTAPHVIAEYQTNQWYTLKAVIDTVNKMSSFYVNGVLCYSKEKFVDPTLDWVNAIYMTTPGSSTNNLAGQYVGDLKITAQPRTAGSYIEAPTIVSTYARDGLIGINMAPVNMAVTENVYASTTPGGPYTLSYTYTPKMNTSFTYTSAGPMILDKPSISKIGSSALVNGTTYYFVVTTLTKIRNADGTVSTQTYSSGYSNEVAVTPNKVVLIPSQPSNLMQNVQVSDAYYASMWTVSNNLQVGSRPYGDAANTITKLPAAYAGADWISPASGSVKFTNTPLVTFNVNDDADIYIALDTDVIVLPTWLSGWTKTGDVIEGDNGGETYNVYKKSFTAGSSVALGNNGLTTGNTYFVMAQRQVIDVIFDPVSLNVNNPNLTVSGSAYDNVNLSFKLNGISVGYAVYATANSRFSKDFVLIPGVNNIDVTITRNTGVYTKSFSVNYDQNAPLITMTSVPPILVTDISITVAGYLSKDGNVTVKLNGTAVIDSVRKAANETFSTLLTLNEGENTIDIIAVDDAGNQSVLTYKTAYVFMAGQMGFNDFSGNTVTAVTPSGEVMANVQITNKTESSKAVTLIFALYNSKNTMVDYSSIVVNMSSGEAKNIHTGIKIPSYSNGYKVKAFVWDSIKGMKPLSDQVNLQ